MRRYNDFIAHFERHRFSYSYSNLCILEVWSICSLLIGSLFMCVLLLNCYSDFKNPTRKSQVTKRYSQPTAAWDRQSSPLTQTVTWPHSRDTRVSDLQGTANQVTHVRSLKGWNQLENNYWFFCTVRKPLWVLHLFKFNPCDNTQHLVMFI